MRRLGDLESVVMSLLWSAEAPMTVREVLDHMDRTPPLAYTTVLTVVDNLHRKGFLVRAKDGRAFRYRPVKARAEYAADLMSDVLSSSGDRSATLLTFVDRMSPEEQSRLRQALGE